MTRKEFLAKDTDDIENIGAELAEIITDRANNGKNRLDIVLFYGEMGSGKTTLIRSLCKAMGVLDSVTSPTFAIVNEYGDGEDLVVYHCDFYRINGIEEVYDLGYEEYLYGGDITLIEWPEKIEQILPDSSDEICHIAKVSINVNSKGHRDIIIEDF